MPGANHMDLDTLYDRHIEQVYRYLRSRVACTQDAEDLTAQTFTAALRALPEYRAQGSAAAWLMGIARHKLMDYYRTRRDSLSLDAPGEGDAQALGEALMSGQEPLESLVGQRLRVQTVLAALARLPADQAEVIRLRLLADLDTGQTAAAMNRSPAAIKMLLYRALRTLRQELLPAESEENR